jgi:hypothetical protein
VTVWSDRHGAVGALSHSVAGERWLHVLNVASFRLDGDGRTVAAFPRHGANDEQVMAEFQHTVVPVMLHLRGSEVLHGSGITTPRGVVALCALSETGKSTLAYGLSQRGYPLSADDALVLDVQHRSVQVQTLPFQVRLRSTAARYFGFPDEQQTLGRLRHDVRHETEPLPLAAVCVIRQVVPRAGEAVAQVEHMAAANALPRVLEHAIYFDAHDASRRRSMLQHYLAVVEHVPVYDVSFCPGFEVLPAVLDVVERLLLVEPRARPR